MKILYSGPVFNASGFGTVNREIAKRLAKTDEVQTTDIFHTKYEFNKGLEHLNKAIDIKDANTILSDYPQNWKIKRGKTIGHWVHEGTKIPKGVANLINKSKITTLWVPSKATYNLFKWNDVAVPMKVIPHGLNEGFVPKESEPEEDFIFLNVNSWTGRENDRKGTDVLIKAFNEEFKDDEKVKLILKIGTFFIDLPNEYYKAKVKEQIGRVNPNILINCDYFEEKKLIDIFQKSDCFVCPTRGEAFGLTILQAMGCGLPVIVTKDKNSGHMDFCKGRDSVLFVDAPDVVQGDRMFFCEGNMLAEPDIKSLRKQMRYAFENNKELKKKALKNSKEIIKDYSWDKTTKQVRDLLE